MMHLVLIWCFSGGVRCKLDEPRFFAPRPLSACLAAAQPVAAAEARRFPGRYLANWFCVAGRAA